MRRDLNSPDAEAREDALRALPEGPASVRAVTRLLDDPNPFVRDAAIERLLDWGARTTLPLVLPRLRDTYEIARVTALECVARWGTARHGRVVSPMLTDPVPLVRAYAAWVLGVLGPRNATSRLRARLRVERHPLVRPGLHEGLFRQTGSERHLKALIRALFSVHHLAACFAARSLMNCVTEENRETILEALRRTVGRDRRVAVRAMAEQALDDINQRYPQTAPRQPSSPRPRATRKTAQKSGAGGRAGKR